MKRLARSFWGSHSEYFYYRTKNICIYSNAQLFQQSNIFKLLGNPFEGTSET